MGKITKDNSGFSILEVIVAILIIAIGMIGILSLVTQNIQAQYINKNVLIASGLAQEGLELVRNVRDLNWLTPGDDPINDWKRDIVGGYVIDYRGRSSINSAVVSIDDTGARLYINNSKTCIGGSNRGADCVQNSDCNSNVCLALNFYTHVSGGNTATNFYRYIAVAVVPIDATHDYLDVKCTIRWKNGTQNHDYVAETYLYNWR